MNPETVEKIRYERDHLEDLADSNIPCADIAQALLDAAATEA